MAFIGFARSPCPPVPNYCCYEKTPRTRGSVKGPNTLELIEKDMLKFKSSPCSRPSNVIFKQVVRDVFEAFRLPKGVPPFHLNDLQRTHLSVDESSPGLPWKDYGFRTKREVIEDHRSFKSIRFFWNQVKQGKLCSPPDCIAYLRTHHVQDDGITVRSVWDYPATISFQEACFALPLIYEYRHHGISTFELEAPPGSFRNLSSRFAKYSRFTSIQYKSFDKTVPPWLIRIAFEILLYNIDVTKYQGYGIPHARNLYRALQYLVKYFINTPVRLCNGKRFRKNRGIASGSYFTRLVGSIVNQIVTTYALRSQGITVHDILVVGEVSVVAIDGVVDLNAFARNAQECGMKVDVLNTRSSTTLQELKFLGCYKNRELSKRKRGEMLASKSRKRTAHMLNHFASYELSLPTANFVRDLVFDACCRSIATKPYKELYPTSLRRVLNILGIDQLPREAPSLFRLELGVMQLFASR